MASNLVLLEDAAAKLIFLLNEVVFIGGSTLELLVSDKAAAPIRSTIDVDVIVETTTYAGYIAFSERLRAVGISENTREAAPLCMWVNQDLTLDVMPID